MLTQETKDRLLASMREHAAADTLIRGKYGETDDGGFRGCAIGCAAHTLGLSEHDDHNGLAKATGVPTKIWHLIDTIFEGLPADKAQPFVLEVLEAMPAGADFSKTWPRFAVWLLLDPEHGVARFANEQGEAAIRAVADLYERRLSGDEPEDASWVAARSDTQAADRESEAAAREATWTAGLIVCTADEWDPVPADAAWNTVRVPAFAARAAKTAAKANAQADATDEEWKIVSANAKTAARAVSYAAQAAKLVELLRAEGGGDG